jgi:sarcosine oxidase subunit beta
MSLWHRIGELVGDDCGFKISGQIMVAENEQEFERLKARAALIRELGYDHEEIVEARELFEILPDLARHCCGGLIARGDGFADPARTTQAFRRRAESFGAVFVEHCQANWITKHGGIWRVDAAGNAHHAPVVINCAGAWAAGIAELTGEIVPVEPIAPMMLVTEPIRHFLKPVVIGTGRALSFKQQPNGTLLIGGGHRADLDLAAGRTNLNFSLLSQSARTVAELFPRMRHVAIVRGWAGIEARMPDDIPVIGRSAAEESVFHAFGFSAHGFQMGPIVGQIVSELVTKGATAFPIEPFRIDRFRQASQPERPVI